VFGKVTNGFDVVQKIGLVPTNFVGRFENVPTKAITIRNVKLLIDVAKEAPKQAAKEASKDVKEATKEVTK
jgi:peptidyl-prolyl cis-trans isomerase A (cyclophilin A)